jgi:hypothetical protein
MSEVDALLDRLAADLEPREPRAPRAAQPAVDDAPRGTGSTSLEGA